MSDEFEPEKPLRFHAHLFGNNVQEGRFGWWYRFWWRVLLGAEIKRNKP